MSKSAIACPTRRRRRLASLPSSYFSLRGSLIGPLYMNRAAAIDRDDLPGHIRRAGEEVHRQRDVFRRADAPERRGGEDARALGLVELAVLWPGDRARRDAVDAHARRELE